ncbi:MAG: peptide deformylase [Acidobacteriota bacterium]|nr:peptide deformylase [Acidobacteriota bacterium]
MAIQRIRQLGDPVLREVSREVSRGVSQALSGEVASTRETMVDLRDTLHEFQRTNGFGRGISAVQIGVAERLIYIEFEGRCYCIGDPVFEFVSEEKFRLWDDCFSFPDLLVWLERAVRVRVRYVDENGASRMLEAEGPLSELLQHEMDHLNGVLAVDRAIDRQSLMTRAEWERSKKSA